MDAILYEDSNQIVFAANSRLQQALTHFKIFCHLHGDRVTTPKSAKISRYSQFNICVALHTMGIGSYTMGPTAQIEVGAYCSIAGGLIVLGERHPIEDVTSSVILYDYGKPHFKSMFDDFNIELPRLRHRVPAYLPPPVIEHDVWIGQNVTLSRGITLGTGSVIAGGSLVTKDVEPYTIVGGNPARKIRDRFEPKISRRLLQSAWWTLHPTQLLPLLKIRDPYTFLQEVEVAQAGGNVPVWEDTPTTADDIARFVRE